LLLCSSYLHLGVPNWAVIYTPSSNFSGAVAGEKEDFCCKWSLSLPIFYFVIVLLYFIFACIFLSKIKKISSFIVVIVACLLFSLIRMSNPEVEVRTFKQ
jgi:L-asparagine transporter-like permease